MGNNIIFLAPEYPETGVMSDKAISVTASSESDSNNPANSVLTECLTDSWRSSGSVSECLIFELPESTYTVSMLTLFGINFSNITCNIYFYSGTKNHGTTRSDWGSLGTLLATITNPTGDKKASCFFSDVVTTHTFFAVFIEAPTVPDGFYEVGRIMFGHGVELTHNYSLGATDQPEDQSLKIQTNNFSRVGNNRGTLRKFSFVFKDIDTSGKSKLVNIFKTCVGLRAFVIDLNVGDGDPENLQYVAFQEKSFKFRLTNHSGEGDLSFDLLEAK